MVRYRVLWEYFQEYITGSYGRYIFKFVRTSNTDFCSGCTSLHIIQQWISVPLSLYPHQYLSPFDSVVCFSTGEGEISRVTLWQFQQWRRLKLICRSRYNLVSQILNLVCDRFSQVWSTEYTSLKLCIIYHFHTAV